MDVTSFLIGVAASSVLINMLWYISLNRITKDWNDLVARVNKEWYQLVDVINSNWSNAMMHMLEDYKELMKGRISDDNSS